MTKILFIEICGVTAAGKTSFQHGVVNELHARGIAGLSAREFEAYCYRGREIEFALRKSIRTLGSRFRSLYAIQVLRSSKIARTNYSQSLHRTLRESIVRDLDILEKCHDLILPRFLDSSRLVCIQDEMFFQHQALLNFWHQEGFLPKMEFEFPSACLGNYLLVHVTNKNAVNQAISRGLPDSWPQSLRDPSILPALLSRQSECIGQTVNQAKTQVIELDLLSSSAADLADLIRTSII